MSATNAVTLRVYDLSQGMASQLSPAILGKQIDGIWHTGVQVFGREYYFGGGICSDPPGMTPYGTPHSLHQMGLSQKTPEQFLTFLANISPSFSLNSYHLLDNNCNNFTDAVCMFLLGTHIPQYILDLPSEALNSPLGPLIRPIIDQMQAAITQQSMGHQVNLPNSPTSVNHVSPSTEQTPPKPPPEQTDYWTLPITLSKANCTAIQRKLSELSPDLFSVQKPPQRENLLEHALSTSHLQQAFPALDYLRLLALEPSEAQPIASHATKLAQRFILADEAPLIPRMMTLRVFVNLFKHSHSTQSLCNEASADTLVESACNSLEIDHQQVRKTAAILLLNFSGSPRRYPDAVTLQEQHVVRILYAAVARLNDETAPLPEEATPLMQSIFLLTEVNPDSKMLLSAFELNLGRYQSAHSCPDPDTREAAARVSTLLA